MTIRTARKIGFFTAMGLLFGSIVGIGIFVKNGSVFRETNTDAVTTLLAWIIGGLLSLFAAISFSEIGTLKTRNVHGLAAWSEATMGKRSGYFVRFNLAFFYNTTLITVIGMLTSEVFFKVLASSGIDVVSINSKIYVHVIIGVALTFLFVTINVLSIFYSGIISTIASIIKFLPLIIAALMGMVLVGTNNQSVLANGKLSDFGNLFTRKTNFSFTALLAALPAILFAYDSFLGAGPLASKTKGGVKTISRVTIITMILVVVLYSFITISQLLHNATTIENLFRSLLDPSAATAVSIMIYTFILVSALGVLNGISSATVATIQQAVATNTFFGSSRLKNKLGATGAFSVYFGISFVVAALIMFVPALALGTDAPVDSYSNWPTVFFFIIYAANILFYAMKRKKFATEKINKILFYVASSFAVIFITLAFGYLIIYSYSIRAFISPSQSSTAGVFADNGLTLSLIEEFGFFIAGLGVLFGGPLLNYFLKVKYEKESPIINTQTLEIESTTELQEKIRETENTTKTLLRKRNR